MSKIVLDTSAVLAWLFQENGADKVFPILEAGSGVISSVNYAELVGKLVDQGMPAEIIRETLFDLELEVVDYDEAQAFETGVLRTVSKAFGLSLGDRACISLGIIRKLPVLTADRVWLNVSVPTEVRSIRG
ncbi:MAG: type II toxin-antitoxin system VapC family toxin [Gallionella sp.]|nr:type II toxin-antitoxin system VapC family toxin [Gallionella sp.]